MLADPLLVISQVLAAFASTGFITFGAIVLAYLTESLPESVEKRTEAHRRFILMLSEQQVVTGLAIMIGTVANVCRLTNYEFEVVVGLA